jgi:hypothetical protein
MPALTPMYGLGSGARTGVAVNISGPRTRIGNQNRIYSYYKARGHGQEYIQHLIKVLGLKNMPRANPWNIISY